MEDFEVSKLVLQQDAELGKAIAAKMVHTLRMSNNSPNAVVGHIPTETVQALLGDLIAEIVAARRAKVVADSVHRTLRHTRGLLQDAEDALCGVFDTTRPDAQAISLLQQNRFEPDALYVWTGDLESSARMATNDADYEELDQIVQTQKWYLPDVQIAITASKKVYFVHANGGIRLIKLQS